MMTAPTGPGGEEPPLPLPPPPPPQAQAMGERGGQGQQGQQQQYQQGPPQPGGPQVREQGTRAVPVPSSYACCAPRNAHPLLD